MIILTPEELVELTGKSRSSAQARELDHMRIPYKRRRNGSLSVARIHIEGHRPADAKIASPEPQLIFE